MNMMNQMKESGESTTEPALNYDRSAKQSDPALPTLKTISESESMRSQKE
jgi:hypothetical protein